MSRDPRIDAYLAKAQPFARPILEHVRSRVHAVVPDVEETLKWSAPSFTKDGKILLMMAAFKAHAALNFWRGQELRGDEANADAMGQFGRLTSVNDLPPNAEFDALIRQSAELAATAPRKVKHEPKPPAQLHPEFAAALAANPKAKAALDGFPPSAQATISTGSPMRSRMPREPSASPRQSNGSPRARNGTGSMKAAEASVTYAGLGQIAFRRSLRQ